MSHVFGERSQAHEKPSSLTKAEVVIADTLNEAEKTLAQVRRLRRKLEPFNAAPLGAAINAAESEVQNIVHRLRGH